MEGTKFHNIIAIFLVQISASLQWVQINFWCYWVILYKEFNILFFSQYNNTNHMLGTLEFVGSEHWAPFNFLRAHPWWTFAFLIIVGAPRQWSCRITKSSWKPYTTKGTSSAKQQAHSSSSWTRWVYDLTYKLFFLFILAVRTGPHSSLYSPCKSQGSGMYPQSLFYWHLKTQFREASII